MVGRVEGRPVGLWSVLISPRHPVVVLPLELSRTEIEECPSCFLISLLETCQSRLRFRVFLKGGLANRRICDDLAKGGGRGLCVQVAAGVKRFLGEKTMFESEASAVEFKYDAFFFILHGNGCYCFPAFCSSS